MALYHSPIGLFDFQADHVARAYLNEDAFVTADTGLGKTHIAMALAALLVEDDLIDHVLVVVERSKIGDWVGDFQTFTCLDVGRYHGMSPAKRATYREAMPTVSVSTYETIKADAVEWKRKGNGRINKAKDPDPGPLAEVLKGKRVLVIYDEATKVKERSSGTYKAHFWLVNKWLRRHGECRVAALTATPLERSPEDVFNIARIVRPSAVGKVGDFDNHHVVSRDLFGKAVKFQNISETSKIIDPEVPLLTEKLGPIMLRKRKTDPDVVDLFPEPIEEFETFPLEGEHRRFYEQVRSAFAGEIEGGDAQLFMVLRQIAAHPMSLTRSQGMIQRAIVDEVGHEGLSRINSTKTDRLREYLDRVVRVQGDRAVVFTFFGPSVIPILDQILRADGYRTVLHYGATTDRDREQARWAIRSGEADVMLSSDAGSRGLNLPEVPYIVQLELPFTYALYNQRMNRNHRIDSDRAFTLNMSFVAEGTIEDGVVDLCWDRNQLSDEVLQDDVAVGAITAETRRRLMQGARTSSVA